MPSRATHHTTPHNTTQHATQHTHHTTPQHTTPHGDRETQRQRQTETERDKETERDGERQRKRQTETERDREKNYIRAAQYAEEAQSKCGGSVRCERWCLSKGPIRREISWIVGTTRA